MGLLIEAGVRVLLALGLTTGTFLAVSPVWAGICFVAMFGFTLRYSKYARRKGEALLAESGLNYPSVPTSATSAEAKAS